MTLIRPAVEGPGQSMLLAKLMAAVRPEFRADPLTFVVDDVVFGGAACGVERCPRTARSGTGLCPGHHTRWQTAGRPEMAGFTATTDPRWQRELPNGVCRATGCRYGIARQGSANCTGNVGIAVEAWVGSSEAVKPRHERRPGDEPVHDRRARNRHELTSWQSS